jgi:hypothetical protein
MKPLLFFLSVILIWGNSLIAQNRLIKGYVSDSLSGEAIVGANIIDINTNNGTTSNSYGFFVLLVSDTSILKVSSIGFRTLIVKIVSDQEKYNINLSPITFLLEEATVSSSDYKSNVNELIAITPQKIKRSLVCWVNLTH